MLEYICLGAFCSYYGLFCSMVAYTLCKERYDERRQYNNVSSFELSDHLETKSEFDEII
jgi:hypothetical protein